MDIISHLTKLQTNVFVNRNDDDIADRLNYRYTVAILVGFAVIVSHRQFSESVIKCWVPAFFTSNYEQYANQVCWISNTYYVNSTQGVPKADEVKKSTEIKYYQWIPFILLIQALFLYIPRILWRLLTARAGLDMRDLVEAAQSYKSVEKFENKKKIMEYIVQNIDQYTSNPRRATRKDSLFLKIKFFGESLFCGSGIYLGNYLVTTYFFIKLAYLVNSIGQFYLMNEFLGKQFHQLGLDILRYLTNTYSLEENIDSVYFPKVVMCDFLIREFGHPNFSHKYSIQCVLPINLYNQQIFTILWFWFLILFMTNLYAIIQWINRMMPQQRRRYVNKRLNLLKYFKDLTASTGVLQETGFVFKRQKSVSMEAKRQKRKFIDDYLKFDGVFILRMISMLTSELVGTEVLHELWSKRAVYQKQESEEEASFYKDQSDDNFEPTPKITQQNIFKKEFMRHNYMKQRSHQPATSIIKPPSPTKPTYNHSKSMPLPSQAPRGTRFKNLIQKKFLTKPAPVHFKLADSAGSINTGPNSGLGSINRARQHRMSLTARRTLSSISHSLDKENNKVTDDESEQSPALKTMSSIRSSSKDSPNTKIKNKRVVFASSVCDEIDSSENENYSYDDKDKLKADSKSKEHSL